MDEKQLSIDIVGLAGAYSYALDCIEAELVNITNKHGKRVAYMSVVIAFFIILINGGFFKCYRKTVL